MDPARRALRAAIESLRAQPGKILEGVYSTALDGFFDVENVVIYNVEASTFRKPGSNGIRARRVRPSVDLAQPCFQHHLDYRLIPTPSPPDETALHLEFGPPASLSVFDVWWAASNGILRKSGSITGRYGLHIECSGPELPPNPASRMKILFDGVIAALQTDSTPDDLAVSRLALRHKVAPNLIRSRLLNPIHASILASRSDRLVRPYRSSVQWHPADDLCEECTFIVKPGHEAAFSAYLYPLGS